jgi:hypothetical protein
MRLSNIRAYAKTPAGQFVATSGPSSGDGYFAIKGLFPGTPYLVQFDDPVNRAYVGEWWDDAPSMATATPVQPGRQRRDAQLQHVP